MLSDLTQIIKKVVFYNNEPILTSMLAAGVVPICLLKKLEMQRGDDWRQLLPLMLEILPFLST